ncbi:McrB family protein [Caminibacter pacificus]|uniref:5-methylcytosine-specific restriction protein B n=1 Tax=Caminibacter pacificus TaxID=1424653 RepID=A0AAJ4UYZ1_9BACT|nr:AAA family ATPase [Caminibacter pacificus]QCI28139.2 hypothetical protein C6V80_03965 [Caminibacter pacificus]ROR41149.1 5-methylcytosine-specific restriction protein B [Caminibacter pacificus]
MILDINGFKRFCKNINFIKSMDTYISYLKRGFEIINKLNLNIHEFDNDEFKEKFQEYVEKNKLHPDLYNDFKSAYRKYLEYQNNFYGDSINEEEIKKRYESLYKEIQKYGPLVVKTLEGNPFAIDINSSSLVTIGDGGNGQERMSISLNKILRIMFEKEDYTYPSYEPVIIQLLLNKYHDTKEFSMKESKLMNHENNNKPKTSLNQILYGPPGTGKTYSVIESAVEIIEEVMPSSREEAKEKFKKYQKEGQIEFVTFHQSYSYEEFVEGLKAKTDEEGNVYYEIDDGIFKELSNKAKKNLYTYKNRKRKKSFEEVFKEKIIDKLEAEEKIKIPLKRKNIYVYEVTDRSIKFEKENGDISHTLSIKTLKDIYNSEDVKSRIVGGLEPYYQGVLNYLKSDSEVDSDEVLKNYILIIDEINRGNISKIFGELITLIEKDKRLGNKEEMRVKLPYSKEDFGVPKNLYIIGTMNTADRSIALMDTALRRRFEFVEMMPEYDELPNIEDIDISEMLKAMNERIEFLYDRDHTIGHAYFINIETFEELKEVFKNKIIPLLQEYFYDDWEKINLVLNNNGFIKEKEFKYLGKLADDEKIVYEIDKNAFEEIENYKKIYNEENQ